jgi:hypothetical protein
LFQAPQHALAAAKAQHATQAAGAVNGFVTRSGTHLMLNGNTFRFSGANLSWFGAVGWAQSVGTCASGGTCSYIPHSHIDEAIAELSEMGANVVRASESFDSYSPGCNVCLRSDVNTYNPTTFQDLDYAVQQAHDHGIRLIISLMDNWHYWQGGDIHTWVNPNQVETGIGGAPSASEQNTFYNDPTIRQNFKTFISTLLNHTNYYTKVQYKNDPTVLAWELGNELVSEPASWAQDISGYIKANDSNHLVADGGCISSYCQAASVSDNLAISSIDMYTDHFYRPDYPLAADASTVASANKVFYLGEYDWTNTNGPGFTGAPLGTLLSDILNNTNVSGDLYWGMNTHAISYGASHANYSNCSSDFGNCLSLTYPEYNSDRQNRVQLIRTHAFAMQGQSTPADSPPGTPLVDAVVNGKVYWQGAPLALNYDIERSTSGPTSGFTAICNQCTDDTQVPYLDSSQPSGPVWYRMRAYNRVGRPGAYSNAYLATYTIDDTNSSIQYTGNGSDGANGSWQSLSNRSWDYGSEIKATGTNGDSAQYTFDGTGVSIMGEQNAYGGSATVSIDGALQQATVSTYKTGGDINQYPIFSVSGLPYGQHTVTLTKTGGNTINVDALTIQGGDAGNATTINDTDGGISYSGNWSAATNTGRGDYNNDIHVSSTIGDSFTYRFTGTGIALLTEAYCDEGTIDVYLDGVKQGTVNPSIACGPRYAQQVAYSVSNLVPGYHIFTAVHTGGSYMLLDALTIQNAAIPEDDTGAVTYTGSWGAQSNLRRGDYGDDIHITANNGDAASFTFTGANVSFLTEKYDDEGTIDVTIDGYLVKTVDASNNDGNRYAEQAVFSVDGLPIGQHTIQVTKTGGSYMLVDAFVVS